MPLDDVVSGALQAAWDWRKRGGLAGSLGLSPAEAGLAMQVPYQPGMKMIDMVPQNWYDNPLLGAIGPGNMGLAGTIRAFHGTPHTFAPEEGAPFGAFKNEAIGSGEGAQAYGWGHYVAGNPTVAEGYQKNLSRDQATTYVNDNGKEYSYNSNYGWNEFPTSDIDRAVHAYHAAGGNLNKALNMLDNSPRYPGVKGKTAYDKAADWLRENSDSIRHETSQGNLLEVHILPDEHELLDWDKPLSQQPHVMSALEQINPDLRPSDISRSAGRFDAVSDDMGSKSWNDITGQQLYHGLVTDIREAHRGDPAAYNSQQLASQALHEAGIPGIKYLDAGSRSPRFQVNFEGHLPGDTSANSPGPRFETKEDAQAYIDRWPSVKHPSRTEYPTGITELPSTSNYVIFDPSNLRIVGRNGQQILLEEPK